MWVVKKWALNSRRLLELYGTTVLKTHRLPKVHGPQHSDPIDSLRSMRQQLSSLVDSSNSVEPHFSSSVDYLRSMGQEPSSLVDTLNSVEPHF